VKWVTPLLLLAGRCQGYDEIDARHRPLDGSHVATGGAGGAEAGPECRSWTLGASPRECAGNWQYATIMHPSCTDLDPAAGYRARCDSLNATVFEARGRRVVCYYNPGTGNLSVSVETSEGIQTCLSYDPTPTDVPAGDCVPLGAAACVDGGQP